MGRFRRVVTRRAGPLGLAFTAWDVWKRIPPKHRKMILRQARKHGPRMASQLMKRRRGRRRL